MRIYIRKRDEIKETKSKQTNKLASFKNKTNLFA